MNKTLLLYMYINLKCLESNIFRFSLAYYSVSGYVYIEIKYIYCDVCKYFRGCVRLYFLSSFSLVRKEHNEFSTLVLKYVTS